MLDYSISCVYHTLHIIIVLDLHTKIAFVYGNCFSDSILDTALDCIIFE